MAARRLILSAATVLAPPPPTHAERIDLGARLSRLQGPAALLEILAPELPPGFAPAGVHCTVQSLHNDRFVLQARLRSDAGVERRYALKVYVGGAGHSLWERARTLARGFESEHGTLALPTRYIERERMLVFPWIEGEPLSGIVDGRKPELIERAARLAADLHRSAAAPAPSATAAVLVEEALGQCGRLHDRHPRIAEVVAPLARKLERCLKILDPVSPALVHGDLAQGQLLWTGERLVLLDLDRMGWADPAFDAGHFLAQLERRCLADGTPAELEERWWTCFRDAYRAAMPEVASRHIDFYRGLTLVRKLATLSRRPPPAWAELVPRLAARACAALEAVAAGGAR